MPGASASRAAWRCALALAATAAVTAAFGRLPGANSTTVGFVYLLVVLGVASGWGFPAAFLASLAATAQYNYFFLPPVGNFTIQDPRNWVALSTFLITATVASQLSAAARRQARAAEHNRRETARLYEFSRAILLTGPATAISALERALVVIFDFTDARIATPERAIAAPAGAQRLALRVGQRELGSLYITGGIAAAPAEAIAALVGIALERVRVLDEAARLEALRASEALKSALLDAVTHDLRTPLTSIKAAVTALLPDGDGSEPAAAARRELLTVIDEESDYLNLLLQNMLDMARIEAGQLRPQLRRQALAPVVDEAVLRARLAPERLRLDMPEALPLVACDGFLLSQALGQLLANAAAYSSEATTPGDLRERPEIRSGVSSASRQLGSTRAPAGAAAGSRSHDAKRPSGATRNQEWSIHPIELRVWEVPGAVHVAVRDHGPGIAVELLSRVFDKFFRDPRARQLRPEGLGMGLAIARGIITAHGGALWAENAAGGGARFEFTLPLRYDHAGHPHH